MMVNSSFEDLERIMRLKKCRSGCTGGKKRRRKKKKQR